MANVDRKKIEGLVVKITIFLGYLCKFSLDLTSYDVIIFFIIKLFVNITSSDVKLNSHFIFLKNDIYSRLVLLC